MQRRSQAGFAPPLASDGFFAPRRAAARKDLRQAASKAPGSPLYRPPPADAIAGAITRVAATLAGAGTTAPSAAASITPEHRLVSRTTLGATQVEHERIAAIGYGAYLAEQVDYQRLDASALENALAAALPTLRLPAWRLWTDYGEDSWTPIYELFVATLYRQLYSPRQLFESMCVLWSDHFNIDIWDDSGWYLKPVDDRTVIRRHALSTFPRLLQASAKSPAMLVYLTNDPNVAGIPNENYARELMELHTLGVDGGYTQQDVREVARCFTGWSLSWDEDETFGSFRFYPESHDDGPKTVLGHAIPAGGGIADGEQVLAILASHPSTSRFIARKLLRHFWGYDPPQRYVDRLAQVYRNTGGNLKRMLRVALQRSWMATATPKLKRPAHLVTSALRAVFATLEDEPWFPFDAMDRMGHLYYSWAPPNGYPDARGYWQSFLLHRWNFAAWAVEEWTGVRFEDSFLAPQRSPQAIVGAIDWLLANGTLGEATTNRLKAYLWAGRDEHRCREALALALASPEFQEY